MQPFETIFQERLFGQSDMSTEIKLWGILILLEDKCFLVISSGKSKTLSSQKETFL
jgi:hypothetical protein